VINGTDHAIRRRLLKPTFTERIPPSEQEDQDELVDRIVSKGGRASSTGCSTATSSISSTASPSRTPSGSTPTSTSRTATPLRSSSMRSARPPPDRP
jgi:hypothetical protein